jgi:hypothetical protein
MSTALLIENDDGVNASSLSPFMRIARAFRRGRKHVNDGEKFTLPTPTQKVPHEGHNSGAQQSPIDVTVCRDKDLTAESSKGCYPNGISDEIESTNEEYKDRAPLFRASLESLVGSLESIDILSSKIRTIDSELDIDLLMRLASKTRELFLTEDTLLQLKVHNDYN